MSELIEVVRCKNCRWYEINELKRDGTEDKRYKPSYCALYNRKEDPNNYCSKGEEND